MPAPSGTSKINHRPQIPGLFSITDQEYTPNFESHSAHASTFWYIKVKLLGKKITDHIRWVFSH